MRTRIKICGVTRANDAYRAAQLGADAIGMVFSSASPRALTIEQAQAITQATPAFVSLTALFLDPSADQVRHVLAQLPIQLLQFHGNESGAFCRQFGRPYLKAIAMADNSASDAAAVQDYADAAGLVFDSHASGTVGGTGQVFDWSQLPAKQSDTQAVILAGGLTPDNVAAAVRQVRPWAVDVASGVESSPGIKDATKLENFINEVRHAS